MIESPHLLTNWILNLSKEKSEERKYPVCPESLLTAYHLQYYQSEEEFSVMYGVDKWRLKTIISRPSCEALLIYLEQAKILWTHRPDIDFIINQIGSKKDGDLLLSQQEPDQFLLILEYHPKYCKSDKRSWKAQIVRLPGMSSAKLKSGKRIKLIRSLI